MSKSPGRLAQIGDILKATERVFVPTVLEKVAGVAVDLSVRCFARTTDPEGKRWAPYKRTRTRRGLLVKTGEMKAGVKPYVRGSSAGVQSTDWKSIFHLLPYRKTTTRSQFRKRKGRGKRKGKVVKVLLWKTSARTETVRPARRWMPRGGKLPALWKEKMKAVVVETQKKALRRLLARF